MDEIGLIIHYIDERGLLFFSTVGGHDSAIAVGQRVWVHGKERLPGVVGRKAIHLLEPAELAKKPKFSDLWIDTGASSRIQAEAAVGIGDLATFQSGFQHLVGDLAMARAFDNKAGVFIIGEAMRLLSQEGGLHWQWGSTQWRQSKKRSGHVALKPPPLPWAHNPVWPSTWAMPETFLGTSPEQYGVLDIGKGPA